MFNSYYGKTVIMYEYKTFYVPVSKAYRSSFLVQPYVAAMPSY